MDPERQALLNRLQGLRRRQQVVALQNHQLERYRQRLDARDRERHRAVRAIVDGQIARARDRAVRATLDATETEEQRERNSEQMRAARARERNREQIRAARANLNATAADDRRSRDRQRRRDRRQEVSDLNDVPAAFLGNLKITMKEPSKKRRRPNLNLPREKKIGSAKGTAQYQSNLQGVTWNKSKECWEVTNHDGQGRKKRKTFSVKTYNTIEAAKVKAEEFRRIQLAQKFEQSSDPSKFAGKYYQEVLCEVSASAPMPTPTSSSPAPPSPAQPPPLQSTQSQEQNVRFV